MEERSQQQQTSGFHVHTQLNVERDARTLGWIMVGQMVSVTLCDGNEPRFFDNSDTNTETEQMTTEDDDEEGNFDPRSGLSKKRGQSPEPQDTIVGRVYSYDYIVKLLILKTVNNPGTPEETYADSVMINVRNIKNVEVLDQGSKAFTQDELVQEFAMGDQSTLDQRRIVMAMQTKVQERVAMLKRKKIDLKL